MAKYGKTPAESAGIEDIRELNRRINMSEETVKDLMARDAGTGFEDMAPTDLVAPFLLIVQPMSPSLKEDNELYNPEAKPGRIINIQSGKVYKECHVIPVRYAFRNVERKSQNAGRGFVGSYGRNDSPNDLTVNPLTGLTERANGNVLYQTGYYLCMLAEENYDYVIIPMASTQLKKSKRWNTLMMSQKIEGQEDAIKPMFSTKYKLSTVSESNAKGTWYGWNIQPDGEVTDTALYQQAKTMAVSMVNFLPERVIAASTKMADTDTM